MSALALNKDKKFFTVQEPVEKGAVLFIYADLKEVCLKKWYNHHMQKPEIDCYTNFKNENFVIFHFMVSFLKTNQK